MTTINIPIKHRDNARTKYQMFGIITNCTICNELRACRKYLSEILCEDCNRSLSILCSSRKINGREAIARLQAFYALEIFRRELMK